MKDEEREKLGEYVNRWKETGEFLEKLRRKEARNINITEEILSLSDASEAALRMYPPKLTSHFNRDAKTLYEAKKMKLIFEAARQVQDFSRLNKLFV